MFTVDDYDGISYEWKLRVPRDLFRSHISVHADLVYRHVDKYKRVLCRCRWKYKFRESLNPSTWRGHYTPIADGSTHYELLIQKNANILIKQLLTHHTQIMALCVKFLNLTWLKEV